MSHRCCWYQLVYWILKWGIRPSVIILFGYQKKVTVQFGKTRLIKPIEMLG